jgi:2,4-dienoyl-CoA reductase-like NADH-dependent reductase (Old Yellow Enzyme family)/thioredoxin reductase
MKESQFKHLFEPIEIGGIKLKNRMIMPAMGDNYATEDGYVTEIQKAYIEERAKGGVAMIIAGMCCIDFPLGKGIPRELCCDDDKFIPGLSDLAGVAHKHGVPIALQLCHAGRMAAVRFIGCQPVAPSPLAAPGKEMPRELSVAEIETIVEKFAKGAERARKAGFDGLELLCTHGYLLYSFLSPLSNFRRDGYGGELRNRARIILDIMYAIKQRVGPDYPVWARITANEFGIDGGITLEESRQLAQWLEEAGAAALNVSATGPTSRGVLHMAWAMEGELLPRPPMAHPHGFLLPMAEKIKEVVNIPVIAVGRISPESGEKAIAQGQADMVVMGRELLVDPELPNKVASGRLEEIRPCIACNECLQRLLGSDGVLQCTVNPILGREAELRITQAARKKRVVVIGGGPAGLEAARTASLRGHEVVLIEKKETLGGKLLLASVPPYKSGLRTFIDYLSTQMSKVGVKLEMGKEATIKSITAHNPDAIIIATGAYQHIPELPGSEKMQVVNAEYFLQGGVEVGRTVAVVGGGFVGCETAESLADKGKTVTIVEMLNDMPLTIESVHTIYLLERLEKRGVSILLGAKAIEVTNKGLIFSTEEGRRELLPCDTIVMATTPKPNQELYEPIRKIVSEVFIIGDCVKPRRIVDAILEGFRIGLEV